MNKPNEQLLKIIDDTSARCAHACEVAESLQALFLAVARLCDADPVVSGLANLGAGVAEDLAAEMCCARDELNAEVRHG